MRLPDSSWSSTAGAQNASKSPHAAFADLLSSDAEIAVGLLVALCARIREAEAR